MHAARQYATDGDGLKRLILKRLRDVASELKRRGIEHAYLFGSLAHGEAGRGSDVDIALFLNETAGLGLLELIRLERRMSREFRRPVHLKVLSTRGRSPLKRIVEREGIAAF